jgi:hypothetical protein
MSTTPERVLDRTPLRFAEAVKNQFSFLETMGFRCTCSEATFVRFESADIGINIYHGRRSFEIGLEMESASSATDAYSFSQILRLVDCKEGDQYRNYATHTAEGVVEGVRQLAELLQRCIAGGVLIDDELFSRLRQQKKELVRNYALETKLFQARRKAEVAWRQKDYSTVVKLLKPFSAGLTAVEVRKLEFAVKHL